MIEKRYQAKSHTDSGMVRIKIVGGNTVAKFSTHVVLIKAIDSQYLLNKCKTF